MSFASYVAAIVALLSLAGCAEPQAESSACQPLPPTGVRGGVDAGAYHVEGGLLRHYDPDQPWDALVLVLNTSTVGEASLALPPSRWHLEGVENLARPNATNAMLRFRIQPAPTSAASLNVTWTMDWPSSCDGRRAFYLRMISGGRRTESGDRAEPGHGVHAYVSWFLDDGRVAITNNPEFLASDWPRAPGFQYEEGGAAPYYVYDTSPDEEPVYWKRPPGMETTLGYDAAVEGLNAAMKGLSTNSIRVAAVAPEDGFPPGHFLHGQRTIAMVQIRDVQDIPCPDMQVVCQVPG